MHSRRQKKGLGDVLFRLSLSWHLDAEVKHRSIKPLLQVQKNRIINNNMLQGAFLPEKWVIQVWIKMCIIAMFIESVVFVFDRSIYHPMSKKNYQRRLVHRRASHVSTYTYRSSPIEQHRSSRPFTNLDVTFGAAPTPRSLNVRCLFWPFLCESVPVIGQWISMLM